MDFWFDIPVIGRVLIAFAIMAIGGALLLLTGRIFYVIFIIGFVLLLASGSGGNKGGYKF
jgi:hypothetical protein